jgi:pseudouridine-5'-phosphate glycosidase
MPYPQNLSTASSVESIIRSSSCVPATIAVKNGLIKVGLSPSELEDLARSGEEGRATKVTTRELGYIMSKTSKGTEAETKWGSTTVASTMHLARSCGLEFFVTGGTGGVHRDFSSSMDVSADLIELGRTRCAVFSAGVKSILDVPRTLEFLETQGVTVGVFQSDEVRNFNTNGGKNCDDNDAHLGTLR